MDAHFRYFKQVQYYSEFGNLPLHSHCMWILKLYFLQGYELLHQMEPFIKQVLNFPYMFNFLLFGEVQLYTRNKLK